MASAIPVNNYAYATPGVAKEDGKPIVLFAENQAASIAVQEQLLSIQQDAYQLVIVPGFTPVNATTPYQITDTSKSRLDKAVEIMKKKNIRFIMVSGGNVHPGDTPFNEAYGMKIYLKNDLGLEEQQIIMDPYAQHSTTNLRNCGRFMLTHELSSALIVTSPDQNFYFGFPGISTFRARSKKILGYVIGEMHFISRYSSSFIPSNDVLTKGDNPLDP
jgi:hypothetical protein